MSKVKTFYIKDEKAYRKVMKFFKVQKKKGVNMSAFLSSCIKKFSEEI